MDGATPPVDGGQVEQTLTFQAPGYSGTRDTYIWEGEPDDNFGSENELWWDLEFRGALDAHTLLRFENIFGTGADQIPVGSTIVSATLAMQVTDPGVADPGELHELLVDWGEYTATFENFGANPGAQVNEDYAPEVVAQLPFMMAPAELQVTSSVARWAIDPATNRGWIFVPRNTNGVEISPSEGASPPALTVVFISD